MAVALLVVAASSCTSPRASTMMTGGSTAGPSDGGGSTGNGGRDSSGGISAAGGGAGGAGGVAPFPCNALPLRSPGLEQTFSGALTKAEWAVLIDCPRAFTSEMSVALHGGVTTVAFSASDVNNWPARQPATHVMRFDATGELERAATLSQVLGGRLVPDGPAPFLYTSSAANGVELFSEEGGGGFPWATRAHFDLRAELGSDATPVGHPVISAGSGVIHTLWRSSGEMTLASSDGTRTKVAGAAAASGPIELAGDPPQVFYFQPAAAASSLVRFTATLGVSTVLSVPTGTALVAQSVAGNASALSADFDSHELWFAGTGPGSRVWQQDLRPWSCRVSRDLAVHTDGCPEEPLQIQREDLGTGMLPGEHVTVVTSDGRPWLLQAVTINSASCGWERTSGSPSCSEAKIGCCQYGSSQGYAHRLRIYAAKDLATPIGEIALDSAAYHTDSILAAADGMQVSVVTTTRDGALRSFAFVLDLSAR